MKWSKHYRTFKLGNLYFKYLHGTKYAETWSGEKLGHLLQELGFIRLVPIQDPAQKMKLIETRYVELPGKTLSKKDFKNLVAPHIEKNFGG